MKKTTVKILEQRLWEFRIGFRYTYLGQGELENRERDCMMKGRIAG